MKAFKDAKGNIRMFRPDMNAKRMSFSMERMAMPALDQPGFIECLKVLLKLDASWVPNQEGYSIYIRPTAIGTSPFLGVQPPDQIKFYAIMSPVGPYFRSGFKPVKLLADTKYVRAWPGGVGNAKVGGNYGASLFPTKEAVEKYGVSQILWLYGDDHTVTEVGAMNIFFLLKTATGGVELVTPSLDRGDILAGVTRDSILGLVRKWKDAPTTSPLSNLGISSITVSERKITMPEVQKAGANGNVSTFIYSCCVYCFINICCIVLIHFQLLLFITNCISLFPSYTCMLY